MWHSEFFTSTLDHVPAKEWDRPLATSLADGRGISRVDRFGRSVSCPSTNVNAIAAVQVTCEHVKQASRAGNLVLWWFSGGRHPPVVPLRHSSHPTCEGKVVVRVASPPHPQLGAKNPPFAHLRSVLPPRLHRVLSGLCSVSDPDRLYGVVTGLERNDTLRGKARTSIFTHNRLRIRARRSGKLLSSKFSVPR